MPLRPEWCIPIKKKERRSRGSGVFPLKRKGNNAAASASKSRVRAKVCGVVTEEVCEGYRSQWSSIPSAGRARITVARLPAFAGCAGSGGGHSNVWWCTLLPRWAARRAAVQAARSALSRKRRQNALTAFFDFFFVVDKVCIV